MRVFWGTVIVGVLIIGALIIGAVGCAAPTPPSASTPPTLTSVDHASSTAVVVSVIDGDTIETSAGRVRLIALDAPERGECGHEEAAAHLAALAPPETPVILTLPVGENETDVHGRLLRYVDTAGGVDLAQSLLAAGLAAPRYDSVDGYPPHPRQPDYRSLAAATVSPTGTVTTRACE